MKKAFCLLICLAGFVVGLAKAEEKIYINLDQVEVKAVANLIAKKLKKNVIIDENVRGKISIISEAPVSPKTAWDMISAALEVIGATVIDEGEYVKIIPQNQIRQTVPLPGESPPSSMPEAAPFVLVYNLQKINASKVIRVLRPLLSPQAVILSLPETGIIIVRDKTANLKRIRKLLQLVKAQGAFPHFRLFRLKYASAEEIFPQLAPLIKTLGQQRETPAEVIKDDRTNSLIVFGNETILAEVANLIQDLDVQVEEKGKRFYVIKLRYASAEELAQVLNSLDIGQEKPLPKEKSLGPFETKGLKIAADKSSNSLIVYATPWQYQSLLGLIKKLDVRKKQILLATTVVEISLSRLRDLGVRWQILGSKGAGAFGGGLSLSDIYSAVASGNLVLGAFSPSGEEVSLGGATVFFPDLLFLFSLLQQESAFNIISNPKILTLDNRKAQINVGQSVPYTTGITLQANTIPTLSFEYKDVGLELTILPHIVGDTVKLEITQKMQDVTDILRAQQGSVDFVAPVTSKREISSEVIVDNGQTIILGGLVSRKVLKNNSKIPGLGDAPLIGGLFRKKSTTQEKTTLFVFITPYIISSPEELKRITEEHQILSEELKTLLQFSKKGTQGEKIF